jgi:hypothetical protein
MRKTNDILVIDVLNRKMAKPKRNKTEITREYKYGI